MPEGKNAGLYPARSAATADSVIVPPVPRYGRGAEAPPRFPVPYIAVREVIGRFMPGELPGKAPLRHPSVSGAGRFSEKRSFYP